jgi:hypothetical protein
LPLHEPQKASDWWAARRLKYNIGLVIAGVSAFIVYSVVGFRLLADFEVTLFTTLFQGFGYLFMMGVANILYGLGPLADRLYNHSDNDGFRKRLFNLGYWFSFALPFSIPLLLVVMYS